MTHDLEQRVRDRLRLAELPAAPERLRTRIEAAPDAGAAASGPPRDRVRPAWYLLPLVAVLAAGLVAVSTGGGPRPSPVSSDEGRSTQANATDERAPSIALLVDATFTDRCGSIGGCRYVIELRSADRLWTANVTADPNGQGVVGPGLPSAIAPGRYSAEARILFMSDEISNGVRSSFGSEHCTAEFIAEGSNLSWTLAVEFDRTCRIATDVTPKE